MRNSRAVSRDREAAGRRQRRIFAERMAGDEGRVPADRESGLGLQHAQGGDRHRHQRRLGVFGELQGLGRPVPDDRRQLFAERRVDLVEHGPRGRKGLRQRLAHADRLGTLPRKSKCCRHRRSPNVPKSLNFGPKDTARTALSSQGADQRAVSASNRAQCGPLPPIRGRLSLPWRRKIRIKRAIRGSRPGAERTVSAIHLPGELMWQGQSARRPVFPPSELNPESFPKGSKGLTPGPRQH